VGATSHFYEPLSVGLLLAPTVASGILFLLSGRQQGQRGNPMVTDLRH
jgi:hypothetical protein